MNIEAAFTSYLRNRAPDDLRQFSAALQNHGYGLEGSALSRFVDLGSHEAFISLPNDAAPRPCWTGPKPPESLHAGQIWMDTLEAMPMILLPAEPPDPNERYSPEALARFRPFRAWMALRPVANWQFGAFLVVALFCRRAATLDPPFRPFERERIIRSPETNPVTGLIADEAILYANWFGKTISSEFEWQAAQRFLGPDGAERLWQVPRREWTGRYNQGVNTAASPENLNLDWVEEYDRDDPPPSQRIFYGEWEAPRDITFRTAVSTDYGLLRRPVDDPETPLNVALTSIVERR
jgi:hypothetical protein